MALVLDNTPLSATCNTYVSLAEANAYVSDQVAVAATSAAWTALGDEQKALYLVRATEFLDGLVTWFGDRYSSLQNLKWPRLNVYLENLYYNFGLTSFPAKVTYATVEMALFLMQQSNATSEANPNVQFDAVQLGPIKIDYNVNGTGVAEKFYPDIIPILLKDLGTIESPDLPNTNRMRQSKLIRS